jgi:hypothetical protein
MNQQDEIGLPSASLVAGRDYPNTYREFVTMFPDNEACAKYLRKLRWPDTFICPALWYKIKSMDPDAQSYGMFFMPPSDIKHS